MKSLGQSLLMTGVLFVYGYILSTAGHDHARHQQSIKDQEVNESVPHEQHDHDHH